MPIDYYNKVADNYDQHWKEYTDRTLSKVMGYLPNLNGKVVLDYGCGTGELIWRMLTTHLGIKRIIGYDPSEEMLQQAQRKMHLLPDDLLRKVWLQNDHEYDHQFDLIVSTSVLHYLSSPEQMLILWRSLLQPGGTVIVLDYSKAGWLPRYFEWAIRLIDDAHQQVYCLSQATSMAETAGLVIERSETFEINFFWQGFILKASAPGQNQLKGG